MKKAATFAGRLFSEQPTHDIQVKLDIIEYEENSTFYVYCPALDLIGYGNSQAEARDSWETILSEYFRYAINKKSLVKDMKNHGWQVKKNNRIFAPPAFTWMLENVEDLKEVYDKHDFRKTSVPFTMPSEHAFA